MKSWKITVSILGFLALTSCDKDVHKVTVERDCSGTYVQTSGGLDYQVCNEEILDTYSDGAQIKIKYENMELCFGLINCELYHLNEGAIEITEIK